MKSANRCVQATPDRALLLIGDMVDTDTDLQDANGAPSRELDACSFAKFVSQLSID
jgi:hypothetical protein